MADGYGVASADLTKHAGELDRLGAALGKAADTGDGVDLGIETYGIIGQAFSLGARQEIADTAEAIREVAAALPDVGEAVSCAAKTYDGMEQDTGAELDGIAKGMGDA